jgi:hypothetical protein
MHLVALPVIGDGRTPETAFRPILPDELSRVTHGWAQASEMPIGVFRQRLVYVRAEDELLKAVLSARGKNELDVARYIGRCADSKEADELDAALLAVSPDYPDWLEAREDLKVAQLAWLADPSARKADEVLRAKDAIAPLSEALTDFHATAFDEMVSAYRALAAEEESRERARLNIKALSTDDTDDFARANGAVAGSTSSGGKVWSEYGGTTQVQIVSQAVRGNSASWAGAYSGMSACDEQRATLRCASAGSATANSGPAIRTGAAGTGYFTNILHTDCKLYRFGLPGTFTLIANSGSTVAQNDTFGCYGTGSSLASLKNGSNIITGTDGTYASGVCGILAFAGDVDDFLAEVAVAPIVVSGVVASCAFSAVPGSCVAADVPVSTKTASCAFSAVQGTAPAGDVPVSGKVVTCALSAVGGTTSLAGISASFATASCAYSAVPGTTSVGGVTVSGVIASVHFVVVDGVVSMAILLPHLRARDAGGTRARDAGGLRCRDVTA